MESVGEDQEMKGSDWASAMRILHDMEADQSRDRDRCHPLSRSAAAAQLKSSVDTCIRSYPIWAECIRAAQVLQCCAQLTPASVPCLGACHCLPFGFICMARRPCASFEACLCAGAARVRSRPWAAAAAGEEAPAGSELPPGVRQEHTPHGAFAPVCSQSALSTPHQSPQALPFPNFFDGDSSE